MAGIIDNATMFKLSYGLFILTTKDGNKDNGCVINTAVQLTERPLRMSIAVNKINFTHAIIAKTGEFNISILTESVPFSIFEQFGFRSGKDTDKFTACDYNDRSTNGIRYLPKYTNGVISARVSGTFDYGSHSLFVADVTEARILSKEPSITYQYYFDRIKPKPPQTRKKGFVCKICGYIYDEKETLPEGFLCPLCKHDANDFEQLETL